VHVRFAGHVGVASRLDPVVAGTLVCVVRRPNGRFGDPGRRWDGAGDGGDDDETDDDTG
jgi:hypothetical protein